MPTALRNASLEAGGQFDWVPKPDYAQNAIYGVGGVVDVNSRKWWGLEAEGNFLFAHGSGSEKQDTFFFGPRILYYYHDRWIGYGKFLVGFGHILLPNGVPPLGGPSSETDFAYAFGGGVDWRYKRNITIRVIDYEYQLWPGFGSPSPFLRPGALTPQQVSAGVKYRFFQ